MFLRNKHSPFFIGILILMVGVFSCKTEKGPLDKYGPFVKNVIANETGAFRGFNLGTQPDTVLAKEVSKPTETDDGYLYYEYPVDSVGSYNLTYTFEEGGLDEIQSEIFIKDASQTDVVFDLFKNYFDDHYGSSEVDMGYTIWTVKSEKFGDVRVGLIDKSSDLTTDHAPGKLLVTIYTDKD